LSSGTLRLHRSMHASMPLRAGSPSIVVDDTDEEEDTEVTERRGEHEGGERGHKRKERQKRNYG
jgi:hypothetical protein